MPGHSFWSLCLPGARLLQAPSHPPGEGSPTRGVSGRTHRPALPKCYSTVQSRKTCLPSSHLKQAPAWLCGPITTTAQGRQAAKCIQSSTSLLLKAVAASKHSRPLSKRTVVKHPACTPVPSSQSSHSPLVPCHQLPSSYLCRTGHSCFFSPVAHFIDFSSDVLHGIRVVGRLHPPPMDSSFRKRPCHSHSYMTRVGHCAPSAPKGQKQQQGLNLVR